MQTAGSFHSNGDGIWGKAIPVDISTSRMSNPDAPSLPSLSPKWALQPAPQPATN
eukprot:m.90116 g.90116  ORF g.90116 m.90116 type:complete len:55 (+) comp20117_c0_seq2:395-559(+)